MASNVGVHLEHCFQNEYPNDCKYGPNEDCPARPALGSDAQGAPAATGGAQWHTVWDGEWLYCNCPDFLGHGKTISREGMAQHANALHERVRALEAALQARLLPCHHVLSFAPIEFCTERPTIRCEDDDGEVALFCTRHAPTDRAVYPYDDDDDAYAVLTPTPAAADTEEADDAGC